MVEGLVTDLGYSINRHCAIHSCLIVNMNSRHYILDKKGNPVVTDLMTWATWFEKSCKDFDTTKRHVAMTTIGRYKVSTVFLGLDHNFGKGPPVLWETMVFNKKSKGEKWTIEDGASVEMTRCSGSREQAEAMHDRMVKLVKEKYATRKTRATRKR